MRLQKKRTMTHRRISFWISLRTCMVVSLLIEISPEVACMSLVNYNSNQNFNYNSYNDYRQNISFIPNFEDNDPDYPYEELLQLVKETKRILNSANITEKMRLNLDPRIYDDYLKGDISDWNFQKGHTPPTDSIPIGGAGMAYAPAAAAAPPASNYLCFEDIQSKAPKRLTGIDDKDYHIINLESDLTQKYMSAICKNPNQDCTPIFEEHDYSYTCEQSFNRIRYFVSVPVGNQFTVDQQRLQLFRIPDGCSCRRLRNSQSRNSK